MKRGVKILVIVLCLALGVATLVACGGEKNILVASRESGSGTRDAFDNLIKNANGDSLAKKADGSAYDGVVKKAEIQNSTGNIMTKVASVKTGIGYISLGSLNATIKAISVEGVAASAENVLNGGYKLQRPFSIMTSNKTEPAPATADFLSYLKSKQAQVVVVAQKYVTQTSDKDYVAPTSALSGTIAVKGSTSVDPLMDKLIADYKVKGGAKVSGVEFSKDAQGSSQGVSAAKSDTTGTVIGMSSSVVRAADAEGLNHFNVSLDAVVVIVNKANAIANLSVAQLFDIYTGLIVKFSSLK